MTTPSPGLWQHGGRIIMKPRLLLLLLVLAARLASGQSNSLTSLLQQGLLAEQASRDYGAAIADYQRLAAAYAADRQIAATAVFRLGECYRAQGDARAAAAQYRRILGEFADQEPLATLSRQNLQGMGLLPSDTAPAAATPANPPGLAPAVPGPEAAADPEDQEIKDLQKILQDSPDDINLASQGSSPPLIQAAADDHLRTAQFLIANQANLNIRAADGDTPLIRAAANGHVAMVQLLLRAGADANAVNHSGASALHQAASLGLMVVMNTLLASNADLNLPDQTGNTPLMAALQAGNTYIAHRLLAAGADPNLRNSNGSTALIEAINHSPEMVQTLLAANANPNTAYNERLSPLTCAVLANLTNEVKFLLAAKADPNATPAPPPLFAAIFEHNLLNASNLLQAGADPNLAVTNAGGFVVPQDMSFHNFLEAYKASPLLAACGTKDVSMVQLLLTFKANPDNNDAILQLIHDDSSTSQTLLNALLDAGVNPNLFIDNLRFIYRDLSFEVGSSGCLLQAAVQWGNEPALHALLEHGANPDAHPDQQETALCEAASSLSTPAIFTDLLNHHADPNLRDLYGRTPLDALRAQQPQTSQIAALISLLHQQGALDHPPEWNTIRFNRPEAGVWQIVLHQDTNGWNHFTLAEVLLHYSSSLPNPWMSTPPQPTSWIYYPDWPRVVICRPAGNPGKTDRTPAGLLNLTNAPAAALDQPIHFGDVLELPERVHPLSEPPAFLSGSELNFLVQHLRSQAGQATLIVAGGQTITLPLAGFVTSGAGIADVLRTSAMTALTSRSDFAHIKVTRVDPDTAKTNSWVVDCSKPFHGTGGTTGQSTFAERLNNIINRQNTIINRQIGGGDSAPQDFLVRNGDVIEVPQLP